MRKVIAIFINVVLSLVLALTLGTPNTFAGGTGGGGQVPQHTIKYGLVAQSGVEHVRHLTGRGVDVVAAVGAGVGEVATGGAGVGHRRQPPAGDAAAVGVQTGGPGGGGGPGHQAIRPSAS